jgi:hypothetical protein
MAKTVCITGERYTRLFYDKILSDISSVESDVRFIFGDCSGVDTCAKEICELLSKKYTIFQADWNLHGRAAGPKRNILMIQALTDNDEVWAYHSNLSQSKGTKHTLKIAKKKGINVIVTDLSGCEKLKTAT